MSDDWYRYHMDHGQQAICMLRGYEQLFFKPVPSFGSLNFRTSTCTILPLADPAVQNNHSLSPPFPASIQTSSRSTRHLPPILSSPPISLPTPLHPPLIPVSSKSHHSTAHCRCPLPKPQPSRIFFNAIKPATNAATSRLPISPAGPTTRRIPNAPKLELNFFLPQRVHTCIGTQQASGAAGHQRLNPAKPTREEPLRLSEVKRALVNANGAPHGRMILGNGQGSG